MNKRWWKSKKVWGTIIGAGLLVFGDRLGLDPETTSRAAWMMFGGVSVEGIVDAVAAFGREWKGN